MATLADIVNDVATLLNRPDRIPEITINVKAAILGLHKADFYSKDLIEVCVDFTTCAHHRQFIPSQLYPRYRKISYARIHTPSNQVQCVDTGCYQPNLLAFQSQSFNQGQKLEVISIDQVIDSYGCERVNTVYEAGLALVIKTYSPFRWMLFGLYQFPKVTEEELISWIVDDHYYAVVYKACATTAVTLGMDQEASSYGKLAAIEIKDITIQAVALKGD